MINQKGCIPMALSIKLRTLTRLCLISSLASSANAVDISEIPEHKSLFSFGNKPTTFNYYLQDPSVMSEIGVTSLNVKHTLGVPRLKDNDITITTRVIPNFFGDPFVFRQETPRFDAASVFATVRTTMDMYHGDLETLKTLYPSDSAFTQKLDYWNQRKYGRLHVTPEAGIDANAYYSRRGTFRELRFFSFVGNNREFVHTCRSSEIVTHETGHSILDIMKPEYFSSNELETGGYHESFGDQTALFWNLSHPRLCELAIQQTGGNLHQRENNFLAAMAEQFGKALGMENGLRNNDDDFKISTVEPQVHAISSVYTGAVYDAMVDAYNEITRDITDDGKKAVKLFDIGKQLREMTIESIITLNKPNPTFSDFAHSLVTVAQKRQDSRLHTEMDSLNWPIYFTNQFTRREVPVVANANLGVTLQASSCTKCRPLDLKKDDRSY
jgi:hypothetical protein